MDLAERPVYVGHVANAEGHGRGVEGVVGDSDGCGVSQEDRELAFEIALRDLLFAPREHSGGHVEPDA